MKSVRRPLIAVSVAFLVLGILGVGAYAASVTIGQNELRPEAGQEVDRDVPTSNSKSTRRGSSRARRHRSPARIPASPDSRA